MIYRISAHAELKRKLKYLQGEHKSVGAALEIQCRENVKVRVMHATFMLKNIIPINFIPFFRLYNAVTWSFKTS